jgi:hypothetical protein
MSEGTPYALGDLLMFAPSVYWRLVASLNAERWPLALGAFLLLLAVWRRPRLAAAVLALAWLHVAWAFLWQRFAPINPAAQWAALGFALQAALLLGPRRWQATRALAAGPWLALLVVLAYLLAPRLLGRPWTQAELFALAPEPTILVSAAWLLGWRGAPAAWALTALALLACLLQTLILHSKA